MKKSPLMQWVGTISWGITGLASLCVGLKALGFDITQTDLFMRMAHLEMPLRYLALVAGAASLAMFGMYIANGCKCLCSMKKRK